MASNFINECTYLNHNSLIFHNNLLSTDFVVDFEAPEYTVSEDGGSVSVCLRTSTGNAEPVTVVFSTRHVTTSGNSSKLALFVNVDKNVLL